MTGHRVAGYREIAKKGCDEPGREFVLDLASQARLVKVSGTKSESFYLGLLYHAPVTGSSRGAGSTASVVASRTHGSFGQNLLSPRRRGQQTDSPALLLLRRNIHCIL